MDFHQFRWLENPKTIRTVPKCQISQNVTYFVLPLYGRSGEQLGSLRSRTRRRREREIEIIALFEFFPVVVPVPDDRSRTSNLFLVVAEDETNGKTKNKKRF